MVPNVIASFGATCWFCKFAQCSRTAVDGCRWMRRLLICRRSLLLLPLLGSCSFVFFAGKQCDSLIFSIFCLQDQINSKLSQGLPKEAGAVGSLRKLTGVGLYFCSGTAKRLQIKAKPFLEVTPIARKSRIEKTLKTISSTKWIFHTYFFSSTFHWTWNGFLFPPIFQVTQLSQMSEKVSLPSLAGDLVAWLQPGSSSTSCST